MTKSQRLEYHAAKMRLEHYIDPERGRGRPRLVRIDQVADRELIAKFDEMLRHEEFIRNRHKVHVVRMEEEYG